MRRFTVRPPLATARPLRVGGGAEDADWEMLGRISETGPITPIRYDLSGQHVMAVVGKRGSGKSYTLGTVLEGLCTEGTTPIGVNSGDRAVLLFDTLGIFQWLDVPLSSASEQEVVREQASLQKGWNLGGPVKLKTIIWRPKTAASPDVVDRSFRQFSIRVATLDASDWGYLFNLDIMQDRMGQLLNDAFLKVTLEGWSDDTRQYQPNPTYDLQDLLKCIGNDREIQHMYQSETRRAVSQQILSYSRNPLFDANGTELRALLIPGHLSVIVMNKMADELRFVLITSLIRNIMKARVEASEEEKDALIRGRSPKAKGGRQEGVPPCWIAADEAQNFLPSERRTTSTDILVKLVREGRNYGISFVLTTQQPTAIDSRIMAQVDTLIAHRLTVQTDIDYVRKNLKSVLPEEVKLGNQTLDFDGVMRGLETGQAVISNTDASRSLIVEIRPRISVHGGF